MGRQSNGLCGKQSGIRSFVRTPLTLFDHPSIHREEHQKKKNDLHGEFGIYAFPFRSLAPFLRREGHIVGIMKCLAIMARNDMLREIA